MGLRKFFTAAFLVGLLMMAASPPAQAFFNTAAIVAAIKALANVLNLKTDFLARYLENSLKNTGLNIVKGVTDALVSTGSSTTTLSLPKNSKMGIIPIKGNLTPAEATLATTTQMLYRELWSQEQPPITSMAVIANNMDDQNAWAADIHIENVNAVLKAANPNAGGSQLIGQQFLSSVSANLTNSKNNPAEVARLAVQILTPPPPMRPTAEMDCNSGGESDKGAFRNLAGCTSNTNGSKPSPSSIMLGPKVRNAVLDLIAPYDQGVVLAYQPKSSADYERQTQDLQNIYTTTVIRNALLSARDPKKAAAERGMVKANLSVTDSRTIELPPDAQRKELIRQMNLQNEMILQLKQQQEATNELLALMLVELRKKGK